MTLSEAQKLAEIFYTVDNECSVCQQDICDQANKADLGFTWSPERSEEGWVERIAVTETVKTAEPGQ